MNKTHSETILMRKITKLMDRYQALVQMIECSGLSDPDLLRDLRDLEDDSKRIVTVVQNDIEMRIGMRKYAKNEAPLSAICIQRFVIKLRYVRSRYRTVMTSEMYKQFYDEVKYISRHCLEMIDKYFLNDEITQYGLSPTAAAGNA